MSYLKKIVTLINDGLNEGFLNQKLFVNNKIIGIAQLLPRRENDKLELLPCYVSNNGDAQYVGPDADYDYLAYHRCLGITVAKANVNTGYGDAKGYDANSTRMSYVVFCCKNKIEKSNDEIALFIQANFIEALEKENLQDLQLKACNIKITDIVLNDLQVFNEEFQGVEYFLKPEQFLLKVNYTIESAFDKKCFKNCCE
jgi:hypothetical protein